MYTPDIQLIKHAFLTATRGSCEVYALSGSHNAKARQTLLQLITGIRPVQSQAGVTILRNELYKLAGCNMGQPGVCLRAHEIEFDRWLRS